MIHAVTYFAPESRRAAEALGLRGFWRSYFGFRGAPLARCSAGVVEAVFFGFAPSMVRQAIPDVWNRADPDSLIVARGESVAAALRRIAPSVDLAARHDAVDSLHTCAYRSGGAGGRPLFAANRDVAVADDPVVRLWQTCTTLREHRGDGHVAAWVAAGMSASEAAVLFVTSTRTPREVLQSSRGWTDEDWSSAVSSLVATGLIANDGVTTKGETLRAEVESTTNRLASERYVGLTAGDRQACLYALSEPVREVAASGLIPFPNPMGLPASL